MQAIIVNGSAEEIDALAKEMQERQKKPFVPETADGPCKNLAPIEVTSYAHILPRRGGEGNKERRAHGQGVV